MSKSQIKWHEHAEILREGKREMLRRLCRAMQRELEYASICRATLAGINPSARVGPEYKDYDNRNFKQAT